MDHVLMALVLFLIVAVIHQILFVQAKKEGSIVAFWGMSIVGLNILWLLFSFFSYDITRIFLKSTATLLYLLLIPAYLSFYIKQSTKEVQDKDFIEKHLKVLIKRGYVFRQDEQYVLTGKGRFVARLININQRFFGKPLKV